MEQKQINEIVRAVIQSMPGTPTTMEYAGSIPVETSARHVHLSAEHVLALFGLDRLENAKNISQPGQFLSNKRVRLIGPRGCLEHVAVLGPIRGATQVELSMTDARALGLDAPLRLSGDLQGAATIHIQAGSAIVTANAAIVAQRHMHMTPADARALALQDGQSVRVRVHGKRPLVFDEVRLRVTEASATMLHIDADEANAAGAFPGCTCSILPSMETKSVQSTEPAARQCGFDGRLMTETLALSFVQKGIKELWLKKGQILTPSAQDVLRAHGVVLQQEGKA